MTLKNFIFNTKFYLQIKGYAIGTVCAPTYANMLMSEFEKKYIYPLGKTNPQLSAFYGRYFYGTDQINFNLKSFMNEINKKHHSIKLDFKFSNEKIQFLDTLVYKDHNNHLQTTLYIKPFDRPAK